MTLKEKFLNSPDEQGLTNLNITRAENNVKIADDYAVEFAEWLKDKPRSQFNRESLEQFKKEKGL